MCVWESLERVFSKTTDVTGRFSIRCLLGVSVKKLRFLHALGMGLTLSTCVFLVLQLPFFEYSDLFTESMSVKITEKRGVRCMPYIK